MVATLGVEGLSIGHFTDRESGTGCTAVLSLDGAVGSVDIRGGAPGTLETALLNPYASVKEVNGVLLTGGSAPGLGAAAGVSRYLRDKGAGYQTPYARIPLVAAAVIYDLGVGSASGCPRPEDAYQAAADAGPVVEEGSVGAGTGATVGKILGPDCMMKGGVALASVTDRRGRDGERTDGRQRLGRRPRRARPYPRRSPPPRRFRQQPTVAHEDDGRSRPSTPWKAPRSPWS